MALTQSKPASIFTPEGNSLAVFIDVNDGELKLKDVFGGVELFSDFAGGGAGLKLKDDALMTATLTEVVDKDNTASALLLSTAKVKAESSEQCPLEIESTGTGGGIALLDNTTTNNTSVGVGALGDNLCFRSGGVAQGTARLFSTGNLVIGSTLSDSGFQIETEDRDASFFGVRVGRGNSGISTNTAVGASALNSNTTGSVNVAVGQSALGANTTGSSNSAVGVGALQANTSGIYNSAFGLDSLLSNVDGDSNTALGMEALRSNVSSNNNVAVGYTALRNNTASNNTAVGFESLLDNTTGINNTAIGYNTAKGITTGSNNTILGANVTGLDSTLANNIIIADGSGNRRINVDSNGNVGINQNTPTARLNVVGVGTTSATKSLVVQNSANATSLTINDDNTGEFRFGAVNSFVFTNALNNRSVTISGVNCDIVQNGGNFTTGGSINGGGVSIAFGNITGFNGTQIQTAENIGIFSRAGTPSFVKLFAGGHNAVPTTATTGTVYVSYNLNQSVTPNLSAMLQVDSIVSGFLPPRMTTAQKLAIATPAAGLMVYDTDLNKLCVYTTAWETITSA